MTTPELNLSSILALLLLAICGCRSAQPRMRSPAELFAARTNYPAHWWTPVATNGAPSWEILPQEARPGEVILSKRHELGLLSNFPATPFTFRGKRYASLEGFWQMMSSLVRSLNLTFFSHTGKSAGPGHRNSHYSLTPRPA